MWGKEGRGWGRGDGNGTNKLCFKNFQSEMLDL